MSGRPAELSRRTFLRGSAAAALAVPLATLLPAVAQGAPLPGVDVRPRSDWAAGLPVPGPLPQEAPGDVRFLIVHHSASPNDYAAGDVPTVLRGFHAFHTGPAKGWGDVAYNFFVDRYGGVWEGRTGSVDGPVTPDATGGSQGFSQICCFVGDHTVQPPTPEAQQAMTLLLAGLAERYGIDPSPGATTTFVSRGSNRWPAGASVTATTIAGHRDMSLTTCPGDAAYPLVTQTLPAAVASVMAARATPSPPPPAETAASGTTPPAPTGAPTTAATRSSAATDAGEQAVDERAVDATALVVAGGAVAAGAAFVVARRTRRPAPMEEEEPASRTDG